MKVGDHVYFAPGIRFSDLDLDGPCLPEQYRIRIEGYYLTPAQRAADAGDGFAAGLLALTAIDAMSRYFGPNRPSRQVKSDFEFFVRGLLPSFSEPMNAKILYEKYRNGLVHEARLKDGCQFEIGRSTTFDTSGEIYLELTREFSEPVYDRVEAPATPEQKETLGDSSRSRSGSKTWPAKQSRRSSPMRLTTALPSAG